MTNSEALAETITAFGSQLGPESRALVAACEGLAAAVDEKPNSASLWKEYREVLHTLSEVAGEVEDDGQARLLTLLRPPVRDPAQPGARHDRAGDSGGDDRVGVAADAVARTGS